MLRLRSLLSTIRKNFKFVISKFQYKKGIQLNGQTIFVALQSLLLDVLLALSLLSEII
jgi:hypothetical protein